MVAEIWSDFGFCGVVFESLVVDAVVFLGFVVNLWVSDFGFCGESLWVSPWVFLHLLVFFFFFSGDGWDGYRFTGLRWKSVSLLDR